MECDRDREALTCKRFVSGLNDYLDGTLDAMIRVQYDRHVAECPRCRIVSETTRKTVELYRTFLPRQVPLALEARIIAAISRPAPAKRQPTC